MKKTKLTTAATLALLSGSVVAPIITNATSKTIVKPTTEMVSETEEKDAVKVEETEKVSDTITKMEITEEKVESESDTPQLETVSGANVDVNEVSDETLETSKANGIEEINDLAESGYLSNEEISEYMSRINLATTVSDIDTIVIEASEYTLNKCKEINKAKIDTLVEEGQISEQQGQTYKAGIEGQSTIDSIEQYVDLVSSPELAHAKDEAREKISSLSDDLTEDSMNRYLTDIDKTFSQEALDNIIRDAEEEAANNNVNGLKKEKEAAKKEIDELKANGNLSKDEHRNYTNDIDAATTSEQLNVILDRANQSAEQGLERAKKSAKEDVAELAQEGYLTKKEVKTYNHKIESAKTVNEVNEIVVAYSQQAVQNAKKSAIKEIHALRKSGTITKKQESEYISEINEATTLDEINQILEIAHTKDTHLLDIAKESAKEDISELVELGYLSETDGEEYITKINAATTVKDVQSIVTEASEAALDKVKSDAIQTITELSENGNLSKSEKIGYEKSITASKSIDEVHQWVEQAQITANERLERAKESAKDDLKELSDAGYLTKKDVKTFNQQIGSAETVNDVNRIVERFSQQAVDNVKASAILDIQELRKSGNLTQKQLHCNDSSCNKY